jgi:hypothetical protein
MRPGRHAVIGLVVSCATLHLANDARAQGAPAAEALFWEGRKAMRAGHFAHACPKFAESQRLDPAAGTLFNLADCEEKRGRLATAWQHFRAVVEQLPPDDKRWAYAKGRIEALETRLPRLEVRSRASLAQASLFRNGVEMRDAALGVPLPVDPGGHELVVKAPGRRDRAYSISLAESELKVLEIDLGEALPPVAKVSTRIDRPTAGISSRRTAGWIAIAAGGAALAASAVTGILVIERKKVFDDHCDKNLACDDIGLSAGSAGRVLSIVSTIAFFTGLAGVGAGTYLVVTDAAPDPKKGTQPTRRGPSGQVVNVTFAVGPSGSSVRIGGMF